MDSEVDDILDGDNQFSLEEIEKALEKDDVLLNSEFVLKELNKDPVARGKRLVASRTISYRNVSSSQSSENSDPNTSSSNSSDNTIKKSVQKRKVKKPLPKKKKCLNKENIENVLESFNRQALVDKTNSSQKSKNNNNLKVHFAADTKKSIPEKITDQSCVVITENNSDTNNRKTLKESSNESKIFVSPPPLGEKIKIEKSVPVYKKDGGNLRLTPPSVGNKMDLYEFEVDENEQPVKKKKKRAPRVVKSRKKLNTNAMKTALQNIVVPERTVRLRCDDAEENDKQAKLKRRAQRFDIVKSIESHVDALEKQKKAEQTQKSSMLINERNMRLQSDSPKVQNKDGSRSMQYPVKKPSTQTARNVTSTKTSNSEESSRQKCESNSTYDYLIYVNKQQNGKNPPQVTLYKNLKDDSSDAPCRGWDANLQPVLVLDGSNSTTKDASFDTSDCDSLLGWDEHLNPVTVATPQVISENTLKVSGKDLKNTCGGEFKAPTLRTALNSSHNKNLDKSIKHVSFTLPESNTSVASIQSAGNNSHFSEDSIIMTHLPDDSRFDCGVQYGPIYSPNTSHCSTTDHQIPKGVTASTPKKMNEPSIPASINRSTSSSINRSPIPASINRSPSSSINRSPISVSINRSRKTPRRIDVRLSAGHLLQTTANCSRSKVGCEKNFGFSDDEDLNDFVDLDKDNSKSSDASTDQSSISSKADAGKSKQPEAPFLDVINRLKGQLNITATATPTKATKQTKLKFHYKNKSHLNESVSEASTSSTVHAETDESGLSPSFLKPARKSYSHTPKTDKTVRFGTSFVHDLKELWSEDEDLFEDTAKEKVARPKKKEQTYKKISKAVKKENKEFEKLALAMNSQFAKIDEFELCVEKKAQ